MGLIDLHVHTTASDGSLSPREVVRHARQMGLQAIAITDHDTVDGVPEAVEEGRSEGVEVVEGVELSVDSPRGTCHLLGYFLDPLDDAFREKLKVVQRARQERNQRLIERLKELGVDLTLEQVRAIAPHGQLCRPHFALAMVKKGYVATVDEAFERYLRKGGPAYVEKFKFTPEEAIESIRRAGGVPVLAHPFTLELDDEELERFLKALKERGLEGIEVYYPDHTSQQRELYYALAKRYDLAITGGTDFHGSSKDGIELGIGSGDMALPYTILEALRQRKG